VDAIAGQDRHHHKIRNEQGQIKAIGRVKAFEGLVEKLALEIMHQPPLRMGNKQQRKTGEDVQQRLPED
jgi:hypothetical protein